MSEEEYRRRWANSIPSEFSATRGVARLNMSGKIVVATSLPFADFERFKALAASKSRTVSLLLLELIGASLDGEHPPSMPAAPEPIRGRRANVSTQITPDHHARLVAMAKLEWASVGALLRHLIQEALDSEAPCAS